jgi:hypothetical protein
MIEKDGIFLSIVMILECWELALFLGLAGKWRMHVVAYFLANRFKVLLDSPFRNYEGFEFIRKGIEKGLDFVNSVLRLFLVLPVESGLKNGYYF